MQKKKKKTKKEEEEGQRFEGPGKWKGHLGAHENTRGNGKSSTEESDSKSRVSDKAVN